MTSMTAATPTTPPEVENAARSRGLDFYRCLLLSAEHHPAYDANTLDRKWADSAEVILAVSSRNFAPDRVCLQVAITRRKKNGSVFWSTIDARLAPEDCRRLAVDLLDAAAALATIETTVTAAADLLDVAR